MPRASDNKASSYGSGVSSNSVSGTSSTPQVKINIACETCRLKKIKCDGEKPICTPCVSRATGECVYSPKRNRRGPDRRPRARPQRVSEEEEGDNPAASKLTVFKANEISTGIPGPSAYLAPPTRPIKHSIRSRVLESSTSAKKNAAKGSRAIHDKPPNPASASRTRPSSPISDGRKDSIDNPLPSSTFVSLDSGPQSEHLEDLRSSQPSLVISGPHLTELNVRRIVNDKFFAEDKEENVEELDSEIDLVRSLSVEAHRKTWWDQLIRVYTIHNSEQGGHPSALIVEDLQYLFSCGHSLLNFVHIPSFFSSLQTPTGREALQPSIVFGCLALSNLMRAVRKGRVAANFKKALLLQGMAQSSFESCLNAQRLDPTLAQAALLINVFEKIPHPNNSFIRYLSSLNALDALLRYLGLPYVDVNDERSIVYHPDIPPIMYPQFPSDNMSNSHSGREETLQEEPTTCECSITSYSNTTIDHNVGWLGSPAWTDILSEEEIRREQSRRVCWAALRLVSRFVAHANVFYQKPPPFFVSQPSNFALLFPGEALFDSNPVLQKSHAGRDSIWALYFRSMFLSNSCSTMSHTEMEPSQRITFALQVWKEVQQIEVLLNKHHCQTEAHNMWEGREYLQHVRMCISHDLQRGSPSPRSSELAAYRKEAGEAVQSLGVYYNRRYRGEVRLTAEDRMILNPFAPWSLHHQIQYCVRLWQADNTLVEALRIGLDFCASLRELLALYFDAPGMLYGTLDRFRAICRTAGLLTA